jgi:hypothetical protein
MSTAISKQTNLKQDRTLFQKLKELDIETPVVLQIEPTSAGGL